MSASPWTQPDLFEAQRDSSVLRATHLEEQLSAASNTIELLTESLADVELAFEDRGWYSLLQQSRYEMSEAGRKQIRDLCRVMTIMNPLIKRGLSLRKAYVWGQGVEITVRDQSDSGQDVNAVVTAFFDDPKVRATLSGSQAHEEMEQAAYTDGELFLALFTNPATGAVQPRWLPAEEISDIVTDPEDKVSVWYVKREYSERVLVGGNLVDNLRTVYYPALGYEPQAKPGKINGAEVMWNAPVRVVSVNRPTGATRGVPDSFAAIPYARSYKEFLEAWVVLMKALARFAWQRKTRGDKAKAVAAKLGQQPTTDYRGGNPNGYGATAVNTGDEYLEAIPKTGATIDADSGRPLASMAASALDVPVTMLLGDPGVTGARAVADTLDQPMELAMNLRREMWSELFRDVVNYVIDWAVRGPKGALKGKITRDPGSDRVTVTLPDEDDRTVDIDWPDFDSTPVDTLVNAIVAADGTMKVPPLVTLRLLMSALRVDDIDEVLAKVTDEHGDFVSPEQSAGQAAADAFRRGKDPAALLNGQQDQQPADAEPPA
jgi:hypothetical protein